MFNRITVILRITERRLMEDDLIGAARRASKVTVEEAASVSGLSKVTYLQRERHPDQFRICELMGLYDCLTDLGKRILVDGITNFFVE